MSNHIFISHSHVDKEDAKWLVKELKALSYYVWIDNLEIVAGEDWPDELEQGVDNCALLLVIWTKDAKNSEWVKREVTRADDKSKPIIPLLYDDTEISISLQTKQHIDFQHSWFLGFQLLISQLNRYLEDATHLAPQTNAAPYLRVSRPFSRSRFLDEHNYLFPKEDTFALSDRIIPIVGPSFEGTQDFASLVVVPIPEELPIDTMENLRNLLMNVNKQAPGLGTVDDKRPELWFSFAYLSGRRDTLTEYWLYQEPPDGELKTRKYLRFVEGGAIEYVLSDYAVRNTKLGNVFNLIYLLGAIWKFVNLACYIYKTLEYEQKFELLLNLRNTRGTYLSGFAHHSGSGQPKWTDPFEREFEPLLFPEEVDKNTCRDKHLQFVYDIFRPSDFARNPDLSKELMVDLSWRLQRSYNYSPPDNRQYIPKTTDFPWQQYDRLAYR